MLTRLVGILVVVALITPGCATMSAQNAPASLYDRLGGKLVDAHKGMKISDAEFTALVEDLVKSLDRFKVPAKEKTELLSALGGMKPQIVGQ